MIEAYIIGIIITTIFFIFIEHLSKKSVRHKRKNPVWTDIVMCVLWPLFWVGLVCVFIFDEE